jgi:hypothetical protein
MAYTPKTWADGPTGNTPITADELNRIETGVDEAHTGLESAVPTSRTVNGKALSSNVTLGGADLALTGYTAGTAGDLAASDTINAAFAKLEARIAELEGGA